MRKRVARRPSTKPSERIRRRGDRFGSKETVTFIHRSVYQPDVWPTVFTSSAGPKRTQRPQLGKVAAAEIKRALVDAAGRNSTALPMRLADELLTALALVDSCVVEKKPGA